MAAMVRDFCKLLTLSQAGLKQHGPECLASLHWFLIASGLCEYDHGYINNGTNCLYQSVLACACRHDEQATHLASVTDQCGNTQQALQELQAEFADQTHERTALQAQVASAKALHAELEALHTVQAAEVVNLNQQLSRVQSSHADLQVLSS